MAHSHGASSPARAARAPRRPTASSHSTSRRSGSTSKKRLSPARLSAVWPWTRAARGSMRQEGLISESKRGSLRLDRMPTSTKSMGLPRPVVSESKTTNSPPAKRERAQRMASSLLSMRAGEASVGMLLEPCILFSSSHGTGALTTAVSLRRCLSPSSLDGEYLRPSPHGHGSPHSHRHRGQDSSRQLLRRRGGDDVYDD